MHNHVFFGSAIFSTYVLDELEKAGITPAIIVTAPDKPVGRGLSLTPTAVKVWGQARNIPVLTPTKIDAAFIDELKKEIEKISATGKNQTVNQTVDCFVVAAYGKIIPQAVLDIPPRGVLNVHPSLLPLYRGATPLQSAMLDDAKATGVTVMHIDALMDHGPIVAQEHVTVDEWPTYEIFEERMARAGGILLARTLPDWIAGKIAEKEQDQDAATFTKKISKEDGHIVAFDMTATSLSEALEIYKSKISPEIQYQIFRKIQAYHHWPTAYFFLTTGDTKDVAKNKKIRVKITGASWRDGRLVIEKVIPEGKGEIDLTQNY